MNKKGNNAWIVCPSKSFPGKLYYFNVITGDAAWCLTEEEKRALNKDVTFKKVSDKCQFYPEPNTPPTEEGPDANIYNFTGPSNVPFGHTGAGYNYNMGHPQIFDQPVFPRFIPNQYMAGCMMPTPQALLTHKPELKKRSFDQITQTSDDQITCTQGYTIPLSKRFGAYRLLKVGTRTFKNKDIIKHKNSHILPSNKGNWWNTDHWKYNFSSVRSPVFGSKLNECNKIKESTTEHALLNSNVIHDIKVNNCKLIKDPVLTSINKSDNTNILYTNLNVNKGTKASDTIHKIILNQRHDSKTKNQQDTANSATNTKIEHCLIKPTFDTQNSNITKKCIQTNCENIPIQTIQQLTLNSDDSIVISRNEANEGINELDNAQRYLLNSNDLRFVLHAKRKKLNNMQTNDACYSGSQEIIHEQTEFKKLKKVTFDLQNIQDLQTEEKTPTSEESEVVSPNSENAMSPTPQKMNISFLKSLSKTFMKTDPWYVVVDSGVLLNNFEFIENFVKKDPTCRLLIPNSVRSYIQTLSVGENGGRRWVMLARNAIRRLAIKEHHLVLQPAVMETFSSFTDGMDSIDGTIECCLQVLECNHAVLVTSDIDLYNKGVSSGIYTYKIEDIKRSVTNEPQVSFSMGKINVKINDNIFMQNTDNFESFPLSKTEHLSVNDSNLFKVPTNIKNQRKSIEMKKHVDGNPAMFHKAISATDRIFSNNVNPKRAAVNINTNIESDIGDDIQLLSLHENTVQNNKLSDNFKAIAQKQNDWSLKNIIANTNKQKHENKQESSKTAHIPVVFERNISATTGLAKEHAKVTSSSELAKSQNASVKNEHKSKININAYTTEELLRKFHVKDEAMSKRIQSRLGEWICCFYQIMEECLSDVLMKNSPGSWNKFQPPWTLQEALLCMKELYSDNSAVKTVANKLYEIISNLSDKHDNLKINIKAADFMRLFGCGALLVESLKTIVPHLEQVLESEKLLTKLLHHIQDPTMDVELPYTSMRIIRSDIDDQESLNRSISLKKPSEIIRYLKIHFPAWKDFDERHLPPHLTNLQKKDVSTEQTVVRTFGKNLNTIKINNVNRMIFNNGSERKKNEFKENVENGIPKDLPNITRTVSDLQKDKESLPKDQVEIMRIVSNVKKDKEKSKHSKNKTSFYDLDKQTNQVKFSDGKNNGPKIIRSTAFKNTFEDESLDYEELSPINVDFPEDVMVDINDNAIPFIDIEMEPNSDLIQNTGEELFKVKALCDEGNNNDSVVDSGLRNLSLDACSFIRLFLSELSMAFKVVYNFIENSIQQFHCKAIQLEDKKVLYNKANETLLYVSDIIGRLKRIIEREAGDNTKLKSLITKAGIEAFADKRLTRYRQVVMKCLEQAQLLEGALKTMLALTNEHCDINAVDIDNTGCHVPYFNIFE